jgi:SpoIID/LytB domain protein
LKIVGTKHTVIVGKELEIRRWLALSHLYSSAFTVEVIKGEKEFPEAFILHGAGWGHGVGLCQIGAAVMAINGKSAKQILSHYFHGVQITQLY